MKFVAAIAALSAVATAAYYPPTVGQDLCCAANAARAAAGLAPYKWTPKLDRIAQGHSNYMLSVEKISHDEKPGTTTYDLAGRLGTVNYVFSTAGENVAMGYEDLDATQVAWMDSPGHKANIMSKSFTVCGGAVANPGNYYTVDFASPMDEAEDKTYYVLSCSGNKSNGANTSDSQPVPHTPQTSATKPTPTPTPEKESVAPSSSAEKPAPVESSPAPSPSPAPAPPATSKPGKCKRMPKGSIAAGKCKPCKKCAANSQQRR
ncbi:hypothetical protein LPJ78_004998 [Coemansia sp. RSA 989]|nr:hypothetical protein BX667DRAFT_494401 [Coemansia mojavensis]KAJ1740352.1 hypothetical protein LPJ68_003835 [Coemansia sp. RSA 1086]KAJ1747714.1 hypothetical protein LPJ79_005055 [Coemansia sp. RSA 1821]KAJ1861996.1 hypothetical protein LPJ78_004998 [Coemansia sp. RSA 989]KAJ1869913.1 hypothetical protein LPJ55_005042 [Coemansia sp. RSA 990]KAJ2632410.1 hypothetical protein H4R22_001282 [Coemansia sp. RSA 1290]KAJ2647350.1 hypothetical protein IWW40_004762 [Coemansia sp. RSA 1250]KAJ26692